MEELLNELRGHVAASLRLEPETVNTLDASAPLFGVGLGLDSIDALELVVMLEREYHIRITDIDQGRQAFASLASLAEFIVKNRS